MEYTFTKRGGKLLILDGYLYILERSSPMKNIWKCQKWYKNKCRGRLHVLGEKILKSTEHNHVPNAAKVEVTKALAVMKNKAISSHCSTRSVVAETLSKIEESCSGEVPTIRSMKRTIQRCRNISLSHPNNPRTLAELKLEDPYILTLDGLKFLLKDTGPNTENRIIIFGTEYSLDLLVSCNQWFADGTFKTVPSLFSQLYTIHVIKHCEVFPVLYILMCSRTEASYKTVIQELKLLRPGLNPSWILTDFERSAISAFSKEFPAAKLKGCFFHFSQCVWRKVQEYGLQSKYTTDPEFALQVRLLNAIAFVPISEVVSTFELLQDTQFYINNDGELSPLTNYFEDVWVGRIDRRGSRKAPLFPHDLWNHFDSVQENISKTNNAVEGWHNSFGSLIGAHHSSVYKFINALKEDEILTRHRMRELSCGNVASSSKQCYRDTALRIKNIVNEISTRHRIDYLRAIAHNYQLQI